jgi:hypothetical protein
MTVGVAHRTFVRRGAPLASAHLALALLALAWAPSAPAQETREHELTNLEREVSLRELVKLRFTAANRFIGVADFGDYKANSYQPEARLRLTVPLARNLGIRLMGTGRLLRYDFDEDGADLGFTGDDGPFGDLYHWSTRVQSAYFFDDDWTLFTERERWAFISEAAVQSNWEESAQMSDGLTAGGSLGVGYRLPGRLELVAGVTLRSKLRESGLNVGPLVEFEWRIDQNWRLRNEGLGLRVSRRLGERFNAFARARWEGESFRLADRGAAIGEGTLQIRQLPVGLGLEWDITRHVRLSVTGGVMAIHRLRVEDEDGNALDTDYADPSPYLVLRFDLRS